MNLVPMTKDGEVIDVHPDCVAAHAASGWTAVPVEDAPAETPPDEEAPKRRGRPRKSE